MASKSRYRDADDDRRGLIPALLSTIKSILLKPISPFISRPALRAYLTTILTLATAFILLLYAIAAYVLFYWSYIPRIGFERTIHLQFDSVFTLHTPHRTSNPYPYGTATLAPDVVSAQGYDVWIELDMPRTRENEDAGNFMVEVNLYAQSDRGEGTPTSGNIIAPLRADISATSGSMDPNLILATSRRPAILPYRSPYVDLIHKLTELPWYILGFRSEENTLKLPIFESISFAKGPKAVPSTLHLELQASSRMQIYRARTRFHARFRGLRWIMYNWRILSAIFFISAFWITEMVFAGLAWVALAFYFREVRERDPDVKAEEVHEVAENVKRENYDDDEMKLSDTERQFPTFSGQPPLKYESPSSPRLKTEPGLEEGGAMIIPEAVAKAAEADDEEDVDFFDSGIGTSLDSAGPGRRDSMRRRRGRIGSSSRRDDDERL
ncbi:hypothetical protein M409DRAFT_22593 [Zasmidium cellare ATCC 36951]|uniref:Seipin n=1 Tax=Zasmidium cellare ATCC 36951 TaxID=1080233 RepID=A0A6A6CJ46_ZASCE|nr:uncharacterized protein M409DRAFT_22593 [Zasmidium cellare ATCC 36951]KAF2167165.1 hypothetical protein M409DRAFT_22593 [Zasmidium cellare ATCC 36951]